MAKPRQSAPITKSNQRIIGLNSLSPNHDLGDGVSVASITAKRDKTQTLLDQYNATLLQLGTLGNQLAEAEKELSSLNSRALTLVRGRYGANSDEYERLGGVRTSERKKRARRGDQPAVG